jgi:hypothetical protein
MCGAIPPLNLTPSRRCAQLKHESNFIFTFTGIALNLVPRLRMSGAIPPLPNTLSWRCAQLKHKENFILTFTTAVKVRIQAFFLVTPYSVSGDLGDFIFR